jgi:16S rRNA processing protein RimM
MVLIGRIVRPHGNKGAVVIAPETDFGFARFRPGARAHVLDDSGPKALEMTSAREHDGRWVVGFAGIATIDDAERLRGRELRVPAETLATLDPGGYYIHDLVGCEVRTMRGQAVGRVTSVRVDTGVPLLVVEGAGEILVPFAEAICRRVDPAARLIEVDPPEGLLELNAGSRGQREGGG